jgi:fucose 4-O-acetylase-like acetyltransferase
MDRQLSLKLSRLSFLGMLTVVYVHAFNFDNKYLWPGRPFDEELSVWTFLQVAITNGLFRFGIPLFFFRSGFLMAETESRYTPLTRIGKRTKTLLLPYVAWSLIGIGVTWLFEIRPDWDALISASGLRKFDDMRIHDWTWEQWLEGTLLEPISFQLWFLRSLFVYSALYPVLWLGLRNKSWIMITVLVVFWVLFSFPMFFIEGEGLLFFSLGILAGKGKLPVEKIKDFFIRYKLFWVGSLFLIFKTLYGFFPVGHTYIFLGYLMHKVCQVFMVGLVWFGYDFVLAKVNRTPLESLSRYNFFVYGSHVPLVYFVTDILLAEWGHQEPLRFFVFLGLPLVLSAIAIGFGWVLDKFAPPVFWVLTGGRK